MFAGLESLLSKYAKWSTLSRAVPSTMIMFGGGVGVWWWCLVVVLVFGGGVAADDYAV